MGARFKTTWSFFFAVNIWHLFILDLEPYVVESSLVLPFDRAAKAKAEMVSFDSAGEPRPQRSQSSV